MLASVKSQEIRSPTVSTTGRGGSSITGFSVRANCKRYFLFARNEAQLVPNTPALTQQDVDRFTLLDITAYHYPYSVPPYETAPQVAAHWQDRAIDLYPGAVLGRTSLSFGKQELYWGPTTMGPFSFSSNAEPTYNLRYVTDSSFNVPLTQGFVTYKFDLVFGKLSGHKFPARPYFNGQKVSFLFGDTLEIGLTRWSLLWGVGHPMTIRSLFDNLFSASSTVAQTGYGNRDDPGDRKSGFDFHLKLPRIPVTVYADSYADDEPNPIDAPRRVAWHPGIYFARLPWLTHMDARFEVASSEEMSKDEGGTRFFTNNVYRDANTNKGFLLGNAVGRDARAYEFRTSYWSSADSRITAGFRQTKGGTNFLPGGSTITDVFVLASRKLPDSLLLEGFVQGERHAIPFLDPSARRDFSARVQLTWFPKSRLHWR
jgi:hypothetical protein